MQIFRVIVVTMLISMIAGCASGPTQDQIAGANYGSPPDQSKIEQVAKSFFTMHLKDAGSAQYQFAPSYKGWVSTNRLEGSKFFAGYILDVLVNAKNSYGGYTGWQKYQFVFNDGNLLRVSSISPQGVPRTLR